MEGEKKTYGVYLPHLVRGENRENTIRNPVEEDKSSVSWSLESMDRSFHV